MRQIVIASQLMEEINAEFLRLVENVDFRRIPTGYPPPIPPDAEVLFAMPVYKPGGPRGFAPPDGWPHNLKWIQLISSGLDSYPPWFFAHTPVTSARGASAQGIAEFVLMSIFAAAKQAPSVWIDTPAAWKPIRGSLVSGATLGIVGMGAIGKIVARMATGLGMKVLAVRRSNTAMPEGVERVSSPADLFARSDHVLLACPSTPETERLVNETLLRSAKRGVHIINVARGTIVDDAALLNALDSGIVGLASLDCTTPEPLPEGHAFYRHPRVRLSPHTSAFTSDLFRGLAVKCARNLDHYRSGEPLEDLVET